VGAQLNRYAETTLPYFKGIQISKSFEKINLAKLFRIIAGERGAEARNISASHIICKKRK